MPRPPAPRRQAGRRAAWSWLSFARASLRWAEIWAAVETTALPRTLRPRGGHRPSCEEPPSPAGVPCAAGRSSRSGVARVADQAFAAASCSGAPQLLATGHRRCVRLWHLPEPGSPPHEAERLGCLRLRGAVWALDVGEGGRLLAAVCEPERGQAAAALGVWDLTQDLASARPLWQAPLPDAVGIAFSGPLLAVGLGRSVAFLCSRTGQRRAAADLAAPARVHCRAGGGTAVLLSAGCRLWAATAREEGPRGGPSTATLAPFDDRAGGACPAFVAASASRAEAVAATSCGQVSVWRLEDRSLLAVMDAFASVAASMAEQLSWATSSAVDLSLEVVSVLAADEVVVCTVAVGASGPAAAGGAAHALVALHAVTGAPLPHPWHRASRIDAPGAAAGEAAPV
ncbi:unnamed protein product, partial [Prorocentrum cordatum]